MLLWVLVTTLQSCKSSKYSTTEPSLQPLTLKLLVIVFGKCSALLLSYCSFVCLFCLSCFSCSRRLSLSVYCLFLFHQWDSWACSPLRIIWVACWGTSEVRILEKKISLLVWLGSQKSINQSVSWFLGAGVRPALGIVHPTTELLSQALPFSSLSFLSASLSPFWGWEIWCPHVPLAVFTWPRFPSRHPCPILGSQSLV